MNDIDLIALAGLLHDIGKFRQRTGKNISEELKSQYCPNYKTHYSHIHAAHTVEAIDEMGLKLKKEELRRLIEIAASHHLSSLNKDEKIIQLADRYASSLDRKENNDILPKDEFIKSGIETPFSMVAICKSSKTYYYPLQKLEGTISITDEKRCNDERDYEKYYEEFIDEVKKLNLTFENFNDFLKLKSLLEKYTTFIPSSTYKTYPDVSLFDHSLATAAIATAIANGDENEFSLIQGDFTSIQSFIFSKFGDSNKYLAKILRAKSLFVNVATELVALKICKNLNLTPLSVVMNAGGKFMILAHKLGEEDLKRLNEIKEWVNDTFKELNYLQTKFIIKSIDFDSNAFKLGEFSKIYQKMASSFEEEKLRFIPEIDVFEDYIEKAKNGICKICGIVPLDENTKDKDEEICKFCLKFKELGERLPKAKYINFNLDDLLSIELDTKPNKDISLSFDSYPLKRVANYVPKFSKDEIRASKYELLDDKNEAVSERGIKTFYHIAVDGLKEDGDKFYGRKYLAILKADIDNLGQIFINGFKKDVENRPLFDKDCKKDELKDEATFSRILYLSRMVDYFFTNILTSYIKDKNIYTVFAGGDDLFLIGHYEDIVNTYEWIINELKDYTKNEDFHLSAAIKLTKANVPVNLMAEFAEDELDEAKKLDGKDALTIFEITLKNSEFQQMLKKREFFENIYNKLRQISSGSSFMYKFYDFIDMQKNLKEDVLRNSRWKYMLRYLIEKNVEIKRNDKQKKLKEEIRKDLMEVSNLIETYDKKLKIPLNLFFYSIRTYSKKEK